MTQKRATNTANAHQRWLPIMTNQNYQIKVNL